MKYLFVGDIHNHSYMFKDIEDLDNEYHFDRIIFMGDYVDDWNTTNRESLNTLDRVLNMKNCLWNKVTLLWGNHESSYCGYRCSGHMLEMEDLVQTKLEINIDKFDFYTTVICGDREYVCTHAGLNPPFINDVLAGSNWKHSLDKLNQNKLSNLDELSLCSYVRGGSYPYSSFIWSDEQENTTSRLAYKFSDKEIYIPYQIVGHTPIKSIKEIDGIYYIDTHSTYRDGRPYGDKSYLIWNENKFEIVYGD